jgi:hypothetical protein
MKPPQKSKVKVLLTNGFGEGHIPWILGDQFED